MTAIQLIFLPFAITLLAGAIAVVTMRNMVHAALCMALCFFALGGLFILLEAPFLGMVSIVIGVGAISILIIFAVMLTRGIADPITSTVTRQWPAALTVTALLFAGLVTIIASVQWPNDGLMPVDPNTISLLGISFVDPDQYLIPFEVASVLLLAAMIGSISVARGRE